MSHMSTRGSHYMLLSTVTQKQVKEIFSILLLFFCKALRLLNSSYSCSTMSDAVVAPNLLNPVPNSISLRVTRWTLSVIGGFHHWGEVGSRFHREHSLHSLEDHQYVWDQSIYFTTILKRKLIFFQNLLCHMFQNSLTQTILAFFFNNNNFFFFLIFSF